ncbi:ras guanine nucleotide exchange factor domain-containing protein [Syncephalastrum racemosum]|uniref:Ras guanine nucleotide exchange factor domain-containing protein n=1 Tax=Syncephalastrum racemosum TaxID=13706 RepID=A0A1X2H613_SYNRA|nr:ras guanine nucleotide exchange factor domain-containing protein [Syncephalastrum racemosum]
MSTNDVICRVCALYPYTSTDASSLSFDQGAVIDVLAQLDSGWWDGWCNGKRGWFPSNYVQIIETSHDQTKDQQFWHHGQPDISWTSRRAPYPAPPQHSLQQQQQQQEQEHLFHQQYYQQPPPPQQQQFHHSTMHDLQHQQQLRLSLAADNMLLLNHNTNANIKDRDAAQAEPSNWILQTTEDGSEVYYYNTVTKEMRYSVPPEEMSTVYQSPPPSAKSYTYKSSDYYDADDYIDEKPRPPVRAPQRTLDEHSSLASVSTSTMSTTSSPSLRTAQSGNDDQLPPNWVRKCTPKGREYYCNLLTDETAWSLEHVDPITGATMNPNPPVDDLDDAERVEVDADEDVRSWSQLNAAIANAIRNLKSSLKQGQIALFREDTLLVVHHIRLLLYMSNSVDKESSPYLKSNKQLKTHHRALLAALAKLVLSAKVASGAWAPMEAIGKLQADADEVLMAVRNFLLVAQEMDIIMHESKPRLVDDLPPTSRWRSKSNPEYLFDSKRPDLTTTLLVLADNVHGAMASFMDSAREAFSAASQQEEAVVAKILSSTPLLVAQFRNLSNTASQFLNALEDIQQATTPRFAAPKQAIHNAMGSLFIASQTITSQDMTPSAVASTFELIEGYRRTIETSVQEVCVMGRQLALEEEQQQQQQQQQPPLEKPDAGRRPSHDDIPRIQTPQQPRPRAPEEEQQRRMHILGPPPSVPPPTMMPPPPPAPKADVMQDRGESILTTNTEDYVTVQTRPPTDKLAKFFGEDTLAAARRRDTILGAPGDGAESTHSTINSHSPRLPPSTRTSTPSMVPERTDFLGSDYVPSEIVFNMEGNVKGGTVTALVQRLTQHDQLDSKFITTFLLTYRSFCSTQELFDALFRRYTLIPPPDLTHEELEMWQEKKLKLVRLRVFNVIKSWLEHYYNEEEDRSILPILMEFTDTIVRESMQFGAEQLIKSIRKRMDQEDDGQIRKMRLNVRTSDMPAPILPKNLKRLRFLDVDPLELARQLTIMDSKLYSRIKPVECLDKNWGKGDSEHIAANVKASIEYSNQVTAWVTDSILSKDEVKKRGAVVKHWILVAERCRYLNNFNTCMAILSAFDNSSIGRLKRTWELMSARTMGTLTGIRRLMGANKNFTEYRDIIHKVNPPCIPFLGIYLQDLTFIEDGNSNYLKKSNHLVNFAKRMKTAEVIRELQQYQSTPYLLQAVPDIQEFIKTHLQSSRDEETLYNLSLSLEPRERGEDTIARRLKESGL